MPYRDIHEGLAFFQQRFHMKRTGIVFGALVTLWPFIALLSVAAFDNTVWNDPNPSVKARCCAWMGVLASWTGTLPLTVAVLRRFGKIRTRVAQFAYAGLVNIGISAVYMVLLYMYFLAVAFGFDHIFI